MAAVCTSATQIGDVVSEVIIHAAATSFIHMQMLATSQVLHSMRKTAIFSGARAPSCAVASAAAVAVPVAVLGGSMGGMGGLSRHGACGVWGGG